MQKNKNLLPRIIFIMLGFIPLLYFEEFYLHFHFHFTGTTLTTIITRQWHIVIFCIIFFIALLIPLSLKRKIKWVEYGLVSAFFISLFVEMFGIPLTVFLASKYIFSVDTNLPANAIEFDFLGVSFVMTIAMTFGVVIIVIGTLLIMVGWTTLYRGLKKSGMVRTGIYSISRHPQYFGFILIVIGWFIGWPTILTVIFTPILIYKYIGQCKTEEKEISKQFSEYRKYKERVPFFI